MKAVVDYGAVGSADDSATVQAAFDDLAAGETLVFPPVTVTGANLRLPNVRGARLVGSSPVGSVSGSGIGSVIAAAPGATRIASSQTFLDNNPYLSESIAVENIHFDGRGIVQDGVVLATYGSLVRNCSFYGAIRDGLWASEKNSNGSSVGSSGVNNCFEDIICRDNGRYGFYVHGGVTDWKLVRPFLYGNGSSGAYLESTAGATIESGHFYTNGNWDIEVISVGLAFRISTCQFEANSSGVFAVNGADTTLRKALTLANFAPDGYGQAMLLGNQFSGIVFNQCVMPKGVVHSASNVFHSGNQDCSGFLTVFSPDCVTVSAGDVYYDANPFRANNAASTAKIHVTGGYSVPLKRVSTGLSSAVNGFSVP